jgi:hypothetical protein
VRRVKSLLSIATLGLALTVGSLFFTPGSAAAACSAYPAGCSTPTVTAAPSTPASFPTASAAVASPAKPSSLAFTGADVAGTVIIGLALIAAGVVVVTFTRRRRTV